MSYSKGDGLREEKSAQVAETRSRRYRHLAERIDQKIGRIAAIRFVAFLVAAATLFSGWYDRAWSLYAWPALLGTSVFILTVWLHRRLYKLLPKAIAQAEIADESALRMRHQWGQLKEGGVRFAQGSVEERELQIFGEVSLFKLICRAHLRGTQALIARRLLRSSSLKPIDLIDLSNRHRAVDELRLLSGLRRKLLGATKQSQPQGDARSQAVGLQAFAKWARQDLMSETQLKSLHLLSWLGLILTMATLIQGVISATSDLQTAWQLTLGAQLILYLYTTGKVTPQYIALITEAHKPLQGLESCYALIESRPFKAEWLQKWSAQLNRKGAPSQRINSIAKYAEALAVRHSALLYGVLAIGLMWELWYGVKVAQWRAQFGEMVSDDLEALYEFEALCSIADYASDHPDYLWPELTDHDEEKPLLQATAIAHPLFPPQGRVANDFILHNDDELYLITGSNMSGKSSFMRAIASNLTLALAGAPVCAEQLSCPPLSLATSIQVTDDPSKGWSRFYAEVRRISQVIQRAESASAQRPTLYLIDEMLSGTNSRERRVASRSITTRLIKAKYAAGIITTHDLDLAQLTDRFPTQLKLAHFSDQFDGKKLNFDYTLHPGVAKTTNALHVLALEGIEIEDDPSN
jgi:hypothetical protein